MIELKSSGPEQTFALGKQLAQWLQPGDVVCLAGDLGAGKTRLSQGLAAGLSVTELVSSPTFTVMNVYTAAVPLYHFDLYRLEHPEELADIGFDEYTSSRSDGIAVIEWPDKFIEFLPDEHIWIDISYGTSLEERILKVVCRGSRYQRFSEGLKQLADSCH